MMDWGFLLLQLFGTFFIIGLFNFGGGGAMLSLIQTQVVDVHGWISEGSFTDIVAISQSTPGPIGINCATFVGYQVMSDAGYGQVMTFLGSMAATVAVVLPSFLIFLVLVKFYNSFHTNPIFIGVMNTLKPSVAGLIGAAAVILTVNIAYSFGGPLQIEVIADNFPDYKSWILFGAAFVGAYFFKVNPIYLILAAGVVGATGILG